MTGIKCRPIKPRRHGPPLGYLVTERNTEAHTHPTKGCLSSVGWDMITSPLPWETVAFIPLIIRSLEGAEAASAVERGPLGVLCPSREANRPMRSCRSSRTDLTPPSTCAIGGEPKSAAGCCATTRYAAGHSWGFDFLDSRAINPRAALAAGRATEPIWA